MVQLTHKKIIMLLAIIMTIMVFSACTAQERARNFGGSETVTLEPGEKLEMITWKGDSLWYLTRPMREDETAETHTFKQDSSYGIFEGTVTIIEVEE